MKKHNLKASDFLGLCLALAIKLVTVFILFSGCSTGKLEKPLDLKTVPVQDSSNLSSDLSSDEAQIRREVLSAVQYELQVDLSSDSDSFSGKLKIKFNATKLNLLKNPLKLEFFEGKISQLKLNQQSLDIAASKSTYAIFLPVPLIKEGSNEVLLEYEQQYSTTGQGLHRFKDPEDSQYYLYTQFESFDANRFLPCFDQPDLRSKLSLNVIAPAHWKVISATAESSVMTMPGQKNLKLWRFPETTEISTYLFSLHAGPYAEFKDQYKNQYKKIPLRIFIRPSLARYLKPQQWFKITKQGLAFYEDYFKVEYPFKKYDQLIVPEFNMGGMENVAAVTYTEYLVPRAVQTRLQERNLAGILLHEMAHMWFGDLVTMKWWNDLWLNESFATIMGSTSVAAATEFKEEWQNFAARTKRGAYRQDLSVTTHPIEAKIERVKEASAIFDGITYNKGASVLKQLRFFMTEEAFKIGVQEYFKKYAYQNTTLNDFIGSLQTQTKKDLQKWAQVWLKQSGVDEISVDWKCEGDRLKSLTLTQKTSSLATQFRPQSYLVGMSDKTKPGFKDQSPIRVDVLSEAPVAVAVDRPCPAYVYPNFEDHAYVQVKIDPISLGFFKNNLHQIEDKLVRTLVWNDIWRMVRSQELPLADYIQILNSNFFQEKNEIILNQVVSTVGGWGSALFFYPTETTQQKEQKTAWVKKLESQFWARKEKALTGSDDEKFWFDNYIRIGESPEVAERLHQILKKGQVSKAFVLDIDRKWSIVNFLNRVDSKYAENDFALVKKLDQSDRGLKTALSVQAIKPEIGNKKKWVQNILENQEKLSLSELNSIAWSLFPMGQEKYKAEFESVFYDFFRKNKLSEDEMKSETIIGSLSPLRCESKVSQQLSQFVNQNEMLPTLLKSMKQNIEEDERCQKIRAKF